MASFYLRTRTGLASKGAGGKHAAYVAGEDRYSDKAEVKAVIDKNLPAFAKDGKDFFKHADQLERANGRSYRSVVFAIPREAQNPTEWAQGFTDALLKDRHAYRLAIHIDPENHNPHAHLVFCERGKKEGAEPKDYFTRQNPKDAALKSKNWLKDSKALYLQHIRQLCPTYTPPMTGEQKIGQTLKHAGKNYEAKRQQRERQVIELRASLEDVALLDKQERETRQAQSREAKQVKTTVEPPKPPQTTQAPPQPRTPVKQAQNTPKTPTQATTSQGQINWALIKEKMPSMSFMLEHMSENGDNLVKGIASAIAASMSSALTTDTARQKIDQQYSQFRQQYQQNQQTAKGSGEYAIKKTYEWMEQVQQQQRQQATAQHTPQKPAPRPQYKPR